MIKLSELKEEIARGIYDTLTTCPNDNDFAVIFEEGEVAHTDELSQAALDIIQPHWDLLLGENERLHDLILQRFKDGKRLGYIEQQDKIDKAVEVIEALSDGYPEGSLYKIVLAELRGEDADLVEIVKQRQGQKKIRVNIEDL